MPRFVKTSPSDCVPHSSTACRLSSHHQAIFTEKVAHRNKTPPAGMILMVPEVRLELTRCCQRQILSLLRLPIPPLGHGTGSIVAYGAAIAAHGFQLAQWCDAFRYRRNHVPQRSPPPSGYQMDPNAPRRMAVSARPQTGCWQPCARDQDCQSNAADAPPRPNGARTSQRSSLPSAIPSHQHRTVPSHADPRNRAKRRDRSASARESLRTGTW